MGAVEGGAFGAGLAESVDQAEAGTAGAGGSVPGGIGAAGGSFGLAPI